MDEQAYLDLLGAAWLLLPTKILNLEPFSSLSSATILQQNDGKPASASARQVGCVCVHWQLLSALSYAYIQLDAPIT